MDVETINLPDGCQITVDYDAAKQAIPDDVWAEMLKHLKEHGFPNLP